MKILRLAGFVTCALVFLASQVLLAIDPGDLKTARATAGNGASRGIDTRGTFVVQGPAHSLRPPEVRWDSASSGPSFAPSWLGRSWDRLHVPGMPLVSLHMPAATAEALIPVMVCTDAAGATAFHVDVDLNQDGQFQRSGELAYARGLLSGQGRGTARLHGLVAGRYQVRARVIMASGQQSVSPLQSLEVLPSPNQLPIAFEPNQGQTDSQVRFLAHVGGKVVFLTPKETVLVMPGKRPVPNGVESGLRGEGQPGPRPVFRFNLVGADAKAVAVAEAPLPGRVNYFIGNDPARWRKDIPTFAKVLTRGIYPGIDVLYHSKQGQVEFDYHVAPGADPSMITLDFPDAASMAIADDGPLAIRTAAGEFHISAPVSYQMADGRKRAVKSQWVGRGRGRAGFLVSGHDPSQELVIDPLLFATYLGGAGSESIYSGVSDAAGNFYVSGPTTSANFPTTAGAFDTTLGGGQDVFVTKYNQAATALVFSTYLGGTGSDGPVFGGLGLTVDSLNQPIVTSETSSNDFPTLTPFQAAIVFFNDAFVTKLNAAGNALIFSTYLGGGGFDSGYAVATDASDNVYVTGQTTSGNFPTTAGVLQTTYGGGGLVGDAFLTKLTPTGTMGYSTFVGGSSDDVGMDIAVLGTNAYIAGSTQSANFPTSAGAYKTASGGGQDVFVTQLNATGTALVYSTYLGGSGTDGPGALPFGTHLGFALDAAGNAYIGSTTTSANFPVTAGVPQSTLAGTADGFITKLNPAGTALVFSTFLGGTSNENIYALTIDAANNVYVAGNTDSPNYPMVLQNQAYIGPFANAVVTVLNAAGTAWTFSTYLGSGNDSAWAIGLDGAGATWVAGQSSFVGFPQVNALQPPETAGLGHSWVAKETPSGAPPPPPPPPPPGPTGNGPEGSYTGSSGSSMGGEGGFGFGSGRSSLGRSQRGPVLLGPQGNQPHDVRVFNIAHRPTSHGTANEERSAAWASAVSGLALVIAGLLLASKLFTMHVRDT